MTYKQLQKESASKQTQMGEYEKREAAAARLAHEYEFDPTHGSDLVFRAL